jgi:class 3 adenylate cyclase
MAKELVERRLSAILAADIARYSALMGEDEARTVRDLKGHQAIVLPMIGEFGGRIIDTAGDGILAEFPSVLNAVKCAVAVQSGIAGVQLADGSIHVAELHGMKPLELDAGNSRSNGCFETRRRSSARSPYHRW